MRVACLKYEPGKKREYYNQEHTFNNPAQVLKWIREQNSPKGQVLSIFFDPDEITSKELIPWAKQIQNALNGEGYSLLKSGNNLIIEKL